MRRIVLCLAVCLLSGGLMAGGLMTGGPEGPVRPDEGMWPWHNLPLKVLKEKYGFEPTQEWLDHVRLSSVRVSSGGSGSFVSPQGLVMTNHHVALDFIKALSSDEPGKDYVKDGFQARTHADELPIPGAWVRTLHSFEDVTARVHGAAAKGEDAAASAQLRQAEIEAIGAEATKETGLQCEVVEMYAGGQYWLYRFKLYDDVRLVFAPESQIAYYGGDLDNFTYPRFCLDVSFVRAYENGKPAQTDHFLEWNAEGSKEGDLVFVSGNPASTGRLLSLARLRFERDVYCPTLITFLTHREAALSEYAAKSNKQRLEVLDELFGFRNSIKAYTGYLGGLKDPELWHEKELEEEAFVKAAAAGDVAGVAEHLGAVEELRSEYGRVFPQMVFVRIDGDLFTLAQIAFAWSRASGERKAALEARLLAETAINHELEELRVRACLGAAHEALGAEHPFVASLVRDGDAAAGAAALVDGTRLHDLSFRKELVAAGPEALKDTKDPMIRALLDNLASFAAADRARQRRGQIEAEEKGHVQAIARARFDVMGDRVYPDATFTLRLSFGVNRSYELGTTKVPWTTNFFGLYARWFGMSGEEPFQLPERWVKARSQLDLSVPFNNVNTTDIIGGNSGSPVIDRDARVIGLVFDGNIQSLRNKYAYDEKVARTVNVDARGIVHALERVYHAYGLLAELGL